MAHSSASAIASLTASAASSAAKRASPAASSAARTSSSSLSASSAASRAHATAVVSEAAIPARAVAATSAALRALSTSASAASALASAARARFPGSLHRADHGSVLRGCKKSGCRHWTAAEPAAIRASVYAGFRPISASFIHIHSHSRARDRPAALGHSALSPRAGSGGDRRSSADRTASLCPRSGPSP